MFIIKTKKYQPRQTKVMLLFALLLILFFSVIWSFWWLKSKPFIQEIVSHTLFNFAEEINHFNDFIQPDFTEVLPMPVIQKEENETTGQVSDPKETKAFDSTYYFFLWDKFVYEFGMTDLDSLTIDSLIKIEMLKTPEQNNQKTNGQEKEMFSLKKDELLFVTGMKPLLRSETASEQDSTDFMNVQDYLFTLEFWRTPLNFQGIKTLGNLITVYGISEFDQISVLFLSRNNYALKIKTRMYSLKNDGKLYPFKDIQLN
jgi:hypothetical protein